MSMIITVPMNKEAKRTSPRFRGDREEDLETELYDINRKLNQYVMLKLPKIYSRDTMIEALRDL